MMDKEIFRQELHYALLRNLRDAGVLIIGCMAGNFFNLAVFLILFNADHVIGMMFILLSYGAAYIAAAVEYRADVGLKFLIPVSQVICVATSVAAAILATITIIIGG